MSKDIRMDRDALLRYYLKYPDKFKLAMHAIGFRVPQLRSLVHKLPYELLERIFIFSVAPSADADERWRRRQCARLEYVFGLTRVCAVWRRVALNAKPLWNLNGVAIRVPGHWIHSPLAAEMFLERCARLPVSFHIAPDPTRKDLSLKIAGLEHIIETISRTAERWESLSITLEDAEHEVDALEKIPADRLDNLERLNLIMSNGGRQWRGGNGLTGFQHAPRLRDVILRLNGTPNTYLFVLVPWTQLTHLVLEYDHPTSVLRAIISCTNLVSASIATRQWDCMFPTGAPPTMASTQVPHLENLDILIRMHYTTGEGEYLGPFLRCIEAPALKFLSLELDFWEIQDAPEDWELPTCAMALGFFLWRAPRVEDFRTIDCFTSDMLPVLLFAPALTRLDFRDQPVFDDFFAVLKCEEGGQPVVPKLEVLELTNVGDDYSEAGVEAMIASRWWGNDAQPESPAVARLRRVKLWNEYTPPKSFTPEFEQTMKKFKSQGLDVRGFYF
ncbi:F-box domain-containing protein [Mycena venus]|uniref:F-box domain-containing protein n=1 Tax=Mycena venus TaxID=2733690 RepID=A0A8H7CRE1_9AGAR|nr:F-box domain-containing protein [Mycena venus]